MSIHTQPPLAVTDFADIISGLSTEVKLPVDDALGVLVVEPDPDLQSQLARMLTVRGYRVVGSSSGDGALALTRRWAADLMFLEHALPRLDPLAVVQKIRELCPKIGIILMSEDDSHELRQAAKDAGALATLKKPFEIAALGAALDVAL